MVGKQKISLSHGLVVISSIEQDYFVTNGPQYKASVCFDIFIEMFNNFTLEDLLENYVYYVVIFADDKHQNVVILTSILDGIYV